jgi:hypothetical protein
MRGRRRLLFLAADAALILVAADAALLRGQPLGALQAKQIEDFPAFRRRLGKTRKFRRFCFPFAHPPLGEAKGSSASDEPNNQTEKEKRP